MRRPWLVLLAALSILALAVAACSDDDDDAGNGLKVLAGNTIVADWVTQVAGDLVEVETLVPAGADLHTFQLTPGDATTIADADLIILVGAGLEFAFEGVVRENARGRIVELAEGMDLIEWDHDHGHSHGDDDHGHDDHADDHGHDDHSHDDHADDHGHDDHSHDDHADDHGHDDHADDHGHDDHGHDDHADDHGHDDHGHDDHGHDHDHGPFDPHIWMDIRLTIVAVERIADELAALDSANADTYHERAAAYIAELEALDAEIEEILSDLAPERRLMVTFHDAFGYLAHRYDLEILGFVVASADEEPSAQRVANLITEMRERGAVVIYLEPQFDSRAVQRIASETSAEIRTLPSDSLSDAYPTYVELMREVAETIAR